MTAPIIWMMHGWGAAPEPTPLSSGGRLNLTWELWRVTADGELVEDISEGWLNGSINMNLDSQSRLQASFEIGSRFIDHMDDVQDYLSPFLTFEYEDGRPTIRKQMGIYVTGRPEGDYFTSARLGTYKGLDLTERLRNRAFSDTYVVTSGSNLAAAVEDVLDLAAITRYNIVSTARNAASDIPAKPGSQYAELVNTLLEGYGCWDIFMDLDGVLYGQTSKTLTQMEPFEEWTPEDLYGAISEQAPTQPFYNQVIVVNDDPQRAPLTATATNDDAASPTSTVNQDLVVRTEIRTDLATQAEVDQLAARLLSESRTFYQPIQVKILPNPNLGLHQAVRIVGSGEVDRFSGLWWIRSWDWPKEGFVTVNLTRVTDELLEVTI